MHMQLKAYMNIIYTQSTHLYYQNKVLLYNYSAVLMYCALHFLYSSRSMAPCVAAYSIKESVIHQSRLVSGKYHDQFLVLLLVVTTSTRQK